MKVLTSAEGMDRIVKQNGLIFTKNIGRSLLDRGLAYKCYCTEEELEKEREEQTSRGETPRYSGQAPQSYSRAAPSV